MAFDTAITADWHAIKEGAEAIANDIGNNPKIKRAIFLGDAVDYGVEPNETVDILEKLNPSIMVPGNHDKIVVAMAEGDSESHYGVREEYRQRVVPATIEMMFTSEPKKFLGGKVLAEEALRNPAEWPQGMIEKIKTRARERSSAKVGALDYILSMVPYFGARHIAQKALENGLSGFGAFAESELLTIISEFQPGFPEGPKIIAELKKRQIEAKRRHEFLKKMTDSPEYVIEGNMHLFHASWDRSAGYGKYVLDDKQEAEWPENVSKPSHFTFGEAMENAKKVGRRGVTAYVGAHLHVAGIQERQEGSIDFKLANTGSPLARIGEPGTATYIATDGTSFEIRTVEFDFEKAYEKMREKYGWSNIPNADREKYFGFMMPWAKKLNDWKRDEAA